MQFSDEFVLIVIRRPRRMSCETTNLHIPRRRGDIKNWNTINSIKSLEEEEKQQNVSVQVSRGGSKNKLCCGLLRI